LQAFFVGFCAALKGLDNQHMHSSFSEFLASLKGDDEKPWVNRFRDRRRGSVRTNSPQRHWGGS
jgi:hypothetical protein